MSSNYENSNSVPCSVILNRGPRLSAREDFVTRTINLLNGVWTRLNYIRELRRPDGTYEHWGLGIIHGALEAGRAIADVHSTLYIELLRTPLTGLLEELQSSAAESDCSPLQLAQQLNRYRKQITPDDLRGGPPAHLRSVLIASELLAKHSGNDQRAEPATTDGF